MSTNKQDGHGAAKAGVKSENKFKNLIESWNFSLLKHRKDFISKFGKDKGITFQKEIIQIPIPSVWGYKQKVFVADGYIPEIDMVVELKHSSEQGTAEEKVMYDLFKIQKGIYSNKKLLYVIFGPRAKTCDIFGLFDREIKKFDPTEEKVKVILDDTEDLMLVREYLKSLEISEKMAA